MANTRRWEEYTPAQRSKRAAQGMTAKRWNAWLEFSPETQKRTTQADYAKGLSVNESIRTTNERRAYRKMRLLTPDQTRDSTVMRRVLNMTDEQVRWTANHTIGEIRQRARTKFIGSNSKNPWWYR